MIQPDQNAKRVRRASKPERLSPLEEQRVVRQANELADISASKVQQYRKKLKARNLPLGDQQFTRRRAP